jgi:hypothetical protein
VFIKISAGYFKQRYWIARIVRKPFVGVLNNSFTVFGAFSGFSGQAAFGTVHIKEKSCCNKNKGGCRYHDRNHIFYYRSFLAFS